MKDTQYSVIDARLEEALEKFFDGIAVRKTVGDSTILGAVRKANGARVDIYTPAYALATDDKRRAAMLAQYQAYEKLGSSRLQAPVRLFREKAFRKFPALALLACDVPVMDAAFDTRDQESRLAVFVQFIKALAELHGAGIVHGGITNGCLRRETPDGAVRLCDFGFSGERPTTVTGQASEYQSRHVVTNAQPRFVDDVHAAGMLGYRIFLGEGGPVQVLTGTTTADEETITAAILGEATPAPSGAELFPEGHLSAEHLSRLLARMTARAGAGAPYSNAKAVLQALEAVLETPELRLPDVEPAAASRPSAETIIPVQSAPRRSVSAATALALFLGTIGGVGGAVYFYGEADRMGTAYGKARAAATRLADDKAQLAANLEAATVTTEVLVNGASVLTGAHYSGARTASEATQTNMSAAETAFDTALAAFKAGDYDTATTAGETTIDAASSALTDTQAVRDSAREARIAAENALAAAILAEGSDTDAISAVGGGFEAAETAFAESRFGDASAIWASGTDSLRAIVETRRGKAEAAANAATDRMPAKTSDNAATLVLGSWLMQRAKDAMDTGRYAEAEAVYLRAGQRFVQSVVPSSEMAESTPSSAPAAPSPDNDTPQTYNAAEAPAKAGAKTPVSVPVDQDNSFAFDTTSTPMVAGSVMQVVMENAKTLCIAAGGRLQNSPVSEEADSGIHVHCAFEKEAM